MCRCTRSSLSRCTCAQRETGEFGSTTAILSVCCGLTPCEGYPILSFVGNHVSHFRVPAILLVAAGALALYLSFPSSAPNPDGLRVFPGLHEVRARSDGGLTWQPLAWDAGYLAPNYVRSNVQKHFLYPLHAWLLYRAALLFGHAGSGLRLLQVANAIASALTLVLFGLLVGFVFESVWVAPAATLGLAFSGAFSAMAANIAEVVPALPWLVLGLILVRQCVRPESQAPASRRYAVWAGVLLGVSTAFYLASGLVGLVLALGLFAGRRRSSGIVLLLATALTVLAIEVAVLVLAGYQSPGTLWRQLTHMPEMGTYGGFRLTNLAAVLFGFGGSLLPVLPDNFVGLRQLAASLAEHDPGLMIRIVALILVWGLALALAAGLVRMRSGPPRRVMLVGLGVFVAALIASLSWGPYHPKLWAYSNVGVWIMAGSLAEHELSSRGLRRTIVLSLLGLALAVSTTANLANLVRQHRPDARWGAARSVARLVLNGSTPGGSNRLVIGGWEPEFDYLTLMVPESSLLFLPDVYLENGASPERFRHVVDERISRVFANGGEVFFMNLFGRDTAEIRRAYVDRLNFPGFSTWLDGLRLLVRPAWHDEGAGVELFELSDTSRER